MRWLIIKTIINEMIVLSSYAYPVVASSDLSSGFQIRQPGVKHSSSVLLLTILRLL